MPHRTLHGVPHAGHVRQIPAVETKCPAHLYVPLAFKTFQRYIWMEWHFPHLGYQGFQKESAETEVCSTGAGKAEGIGSMSSRPGISWFSWNSAI